MRRKRIDLGPYAGWTEPERLVFNVERAYRELRGEPYDAPIDVAGLFRGHVRAAPGAAGADVGVSTGSSTEPLEFWFEFASTYSYPAAMRVEDAARAAGVPLVWRPFLLGPIFGAQGWNDSPFNVYPVKGRYMWRDLERVCAKHGLPLPAARAFPRNGLLAARVACSRRRRALGRRLRARASTTRTSPRIARSPTRRWSARCSTALGSAGAALARARARPPENKEPPARADRGGARALGIFGAPSVRRRRRALLGQRSPRGRARLAPRVGWRGVASQRLNGAIGA